MVCRLKCKGRLPLEAALVWRTQLTKAARQLAQFGQVGPRVIHRTRQRIKRLRALLKLFRRPLGPHYSVLNSALRDAAAPTSSLRDADVVCNTTRYFLKRQAIRAPSVAQRITESIARSMRSGRGTKVATVVHRFRKRILEMVDYQGIITSSEIRKRDMRRGLRAGFRAARRSFREYTKAKTIENRHEWRKRTKDVFYQLELTELYSRRSRRKLSERWKRLGGLLGDVRDVELYLGRVSKLGQKVVTRADRARLMEACRRRKQQLMERAERIGKSITSDSAQDFVRGYRIAGRGR